MLAGVAICACATVGLVIYRTSGPGEAINYGREVTSPGFLFVAAMCTWLWRQPKTMLPLQGLIFFLLLPLLGGICGTALHFMDLAFPLKWDGVLYRIDAGIGQPAWWLGRLFNEGFGRAFLEQIYETWGILVVICWLLNRLDSGGRPREFLAAYAVNLVIGCSLFLLLPASGPVYAFAGYPAIVPSPSLNLIPVGAFPNSIPSLHVSGAILLFLYSRGRARAFFGACCIGTAVATLALGEHYLIDLVVAVPFACFTSVAVEKRWNRAALALSCVLSWMLAIRWFPGAVVEYPIQVWIAAVITVCGWAVFRADDGKLLQVEWPGNRVAEKVWR
jgi:hypothetical protein